MINNLDHEVAGGVKDGRMWKVIERFLGGMHWYCGYVELLPQDYYYRHAEAAEDELPAPGGITYTTDVYGHIPELPEEMKWVGFDTNHAFMEDYTQKMAVLDTLKLVRLLNILDGKPYVE